jgi:hypothetical protein
MDLILIPDGHDFAVSFLFGDVTLDHIRKLGLGLDKLNIGRIAKIFNNGFKGCANVGDRGAGGAGLSTS